MFIGTDKKLDFKALFEVSKFLTLILLYHLLSFVSAFCTAHSKLQCINIYLRFSFLHSSLVDYLTQVINAKNCPTTFYCIFQLVWVPMTTTHNIRVCFLSSNNTLFFISVPPLDKEILNEFKTGTNINSKIQ